MSLHTLASHLQSAGRGEDKVLVHMTPGEVNGLQKLAMAHGGSLTTNPETGLPEAGFLSSLLPMIAGFALGPAGAGIAFGGMSSAVSAGLLVGGATSLATGSLGKGLMAGFGAYGGAGLGEGLMGMGAAAGPGATIAPIGTDAASAAKLTDIYSGTGAMTAAPGAATNTAGLQALGGSPGSYFDAKLGAYNAANPVNAPTMYGLPKVDASTMVGRITEPFDYGLSGTNVGFKGGEIPFKSNFMPEASELQVRQAISRGFNSTPGSTMTLTQPNVSSAIEGLPSAGERMMGGTYVQGVQPSADALSKGLYNPSIANANVSAYPGSHWTSSTYGNPTTTLDAAGMGSAPTSVAEAASKGPFDKFDQLKAGFKASTKDFEGLKGLYGEMPTGSVMALGGSMVKALTPEEKAFEEKKNEGLIRPYTYAYNPTGVDQEPVYGSAERVYFNPTYTAGKPYKAPGPEYAAKGGLMALAQGGIADSATLALPDRPPVDKMTAEQAIGSNNSYPMANQRSAAYSSPINRPSSQPVIDASGGPEVDAYTGEPKFAEGGETTGGYKYGYDPKTQKFTQLSSPKPVEEKLPFTPMGGGGTGFTGMIKKATTPPPVVPEAPIVTGGIVPPAYQQQPMRQNTQAGLGGASQNLVPNINIPAYQTPEQQLGLESFYPQMEAQLAKRGADMIARGFAGGGVTGTGAIDLHVPIDFNNVGNQGTNGYTPMGTSSSTGSSGSVIPQIALGQQDQPQAQQFSDIYNQNYSGYAGGGYTRANPLNQKMASVDTVAAQMRTQQGLQKTIAAARNGDQAALVALEKAGYDMNKLNEFAGGGGISTLGGYSDGGRLLRGPGDGVSDSIPASIGNRQPARLADGEFVVPARIVSELGNGSTEAGAKQLYAMMDRVQKSRRKTVGKGKIAVNSRASKHLPA